MPKTTSYNIKMQDGTTLQTTGLVINQIWGIDKREIEVEGRTSNRFFLTHIPTGTMIMGANTQKALKEFVSRPKVVDCSDFKVLLGEVWEFCNDRDWKV